MRERGGIGRRERDRFRVSGLEREMLGFRERNIEIGRKRNSMFGILKTKRLGFMVLNRYMEREGERLWVRFSKQERGIGCLRFKKRNKLRVRSLKK